MYITQQAPMDVIWLNIAWNTAIYWILIVFTWQTTLIHFIFVYIH